MFILAQQGLNSVCVQRDGPLSFGMPQIYHKGHFGCIVHGKPVEQCEVLMAGYVSIKLDELAGDSGLTTRQKCLEHVLQS